MRGRSLFVLGFTLIACCLLGDADAGEVPSSSATITSLPGKDICSLQGTFPKKFGLSLDEKWEHSVEYRDRDGVIAVFLLGKSGPPTYCGIVDAVLDLTRLIKKGEAPYLKCHVDAEGPTKWGNVVGLADNHAGKRRFVKARLAWKVNVTQERFEEVKGVSCDTSGYIYGNGRY